MTKDENREKDENQESSSPDNLNAIAKALIVSIAWSLADLGSKKTDKKEQDGKQETPFSE